MTPATARAVTPVSIPVSRDFDLAVDERGRRVLRTRLEGASLLRIALTNKGTAFSEEERSALGLEGLLPPEVNTLEQQITRAHASFSSAPTPIAKYQFLRALQDRNEVLFYALLGRYVHEMLPIVYTPTVGEAVQRFSAIYQSTRGLSFSHRNIARARQVADNFPLDDVRMIVATDSSAILGIGDQGYGGLGIPIGKLSLYTVGGVSPFHTLPIALDVGTDRADLRADPLYLGVREARLRGEDYLAFVDRFVEAIRVRYPHAILQWEDLSKDAAFTVLARHRKTLPSFNDDIQGTGAVALAGVLGACELRGERLRDQRVVVFGAGAGGVGVASAIREGLVRDGLSREEASRRVFVLDSKGLLTADRAMEEYKRDFAQPRVAFEAWGCAGAVPTLLETIRGARATVLLGLSGVSGTFDETVVKAMAANTERPIVFPLSNPTSACEATPEEILRWTNGKALVATGSPFADVEYEGRTIAVGQGNNAFIFPGLGLGAMLAEAREVTDAMVLEAAYALADLVRARHLAKGHVYPPVDELADVAAIVGAKVLETAHRDGVARAPRPEGDLVAWVRARQWRAEYLPVVRA